MPKSMGVVCLSLKDKRKIICRTREFYGFFIYKHKKLINFNYKTFKLETHTYKRDRISLFPFLVLPFLQLRSVVKQDHTLYCFDLC